MSRWHGSHVCTIENHILNLNPFTGSFADRSVITAGLDGYIWLFQTDDWGNFLTRLSKLSDFKKTDRQVKRYFLSQAEEDVVVNNQVIIPPRFQSKVESNVMVVGMLDHLELWKLSDFEDQEQPDVESLIEEIEL